MAVHAASAAPAHLRVSETLTGSSWTAVRFNITHDTDLRVEGESYTCNEHGGRVSVGTFDIRDGSYGLQYMAPQASPGSLQYPVAIRAATVSAEPAVGVPPYVDFAGSCVRAPAAFRAGYGPLASEAVTLVFFSDGSHATVHLNATWTRGVLEHDVRTGPLVSKDLVEFDLVVAGASSRLQPAEFLLVGREREVTAGDAVGFLVPPNVGDWSCTRNGLPCGEPQGEVFPYALIQSRRLTTWAWDTSLAMNQAPTTNFAIADLGDDTYLR